MDSIVDLKPYVPGTVRHRTIGLCALALAVGLCRVSLGQVQVVNMVATANSGETQRDSEPNIAVDPKNPLLIAASAFTPDPNGTLNGVLYFSIDGGQSWNLTPAFVPAGQSMMGCIASFCDVSVRYAASSSLLYMGDLAVDNGQNTNLAVGRVSNISTNARNYTLLETRNSTGVNQYPDQPWVEATTVLEFAGQGSDHTYVGNNDTTQANRTATVDVSLNPVPPPSAGFNANVIEGLNTCGRNGPSIRPAIHLAEQHWAAGNNRCANSIPAEAR